MGLQGVKGPDYEQCATRWDMDQHLDQDEILVLDLDQDQDQDLDHVVSLGYGETGELRWRGFLCTSLLNSDLVV